MGNRFPLSSKQPLPELSLSRGTVEDLANAPFFVIWWGFVPLPQVNAIKWGCRGLTESPHNKTDLVWAVAAAGAPSSWGRCRWGAEQHPQAPQVTLSPCVIGSAEKQLLRGEIGPTFNWCPCCLEQRAKESCCWAPGCPLSVSWGCLLSGCNSLQEFPRAATAGCPQPARCPGLTGVLGRRKAPGWELLGTVGIASAHRAGCSWDLQDTRSRCPQRGPSTELRGAPQRGGNFQTARGTRRATSFLQKQPLDLTGLIRSSCQRCPLFIQLCVLRLHYL